MTDHTLLFGSVSALRQQLRLAWSAAVRVRARRPALEAAAAGAPLVVRIDIGKICMYLEIVMPILDDSGVV